MNHFSAKRVFQLIRTELKLVGSGFWITLLAFVATFALWQIVNVPYDEGLPSRVLNSYLPIILTGIGIIFFVRVHRLLHENSAVPFVSIPATAGEKLLKLLLLGVIYFCMALLIIQVNVWIEYALYPTTSYSPGYNLSIQWILIKDTLFLNPTVFFVQEAFSFLVFIIGILLFISVTIPKKIIAYPLFFVAPIGILFIIAKIFNWLGWNNIESPVDNESIMIVLGFVLGIGALVGSYFILRKKEVKS